jgi:hypothetical protein
MNLDINNLDNSEKSRILEMHKKHGHSLSEQIRPVTTDADKEALRKAAEAMMDNKEYGIPGLDDNSKQGGLRPKDIAIPQTIEIGSSLFKNGIANIDKTNTGYKDAIAKLKKLPSGISVDIIGGASKVGSEQGFNNEKLAMLRATNFIKAAQSDGVKVPMTTSSEVGVATKKNSPDAEKEQFVKIEFIKTGRSNMTTDIDNTRVDIKKPGRYSDDTEDFRSNKFKMCLGDLTGAEYMELLKRFKNKIKSRSIQ